MKKLKILEILNPIQSQYPKGEKELLEKTIIANDINVDLGALTFVAGCSVAVLMRGAEFVSNFAYSPDLNFLSAIGVLAGVGAVYALYNLQQFSQNSEKYENEYGNLDFYKEFKRIQKHENNKNAKTAKNDKTDEKINIGGVLEKNENSKNL